MCNRFVRPKKDDLCLSHTSLMTHSEFGSGVINNRHFLFWGEKTVDLDDRPVSFQVREGGGGERGKGRRRGRERESGKEEMWEGKG